MKMMPAPDLRTHAQPAAPGLCCRQKSIHLREKNIVGPTGEIKNALRFLVRRAGPTFFDEDDACAGSQDPRAAGCPWTLLPAEKHPSS